jgi:recombinational DNA repair protein (RecF pathway)
MFKSIDRCALCGKIDDRDNLILYPFPEGPKLVCKDCYRRLPKKPIEDFVNPKKRRPNDDIFPPRM